MLKKILVPLDVSRTVEAAVAKSIRMAKNTGAEVTALAIVDEPGILHSELVPAGAYEYLEKKHEVQIARAEESARACLDDFAKQSRAGGLENVSLKLERGIPADVIMRELHRHDLLLVGQGACFCHGYGEDKPCDTLKKLHREGTRPIITVPHTLSQTGKGILMATDGSPVFSRTMQMYQLMGLYGRRKIDIISIQKDVALAQEYCTYAAEYLAAHSIKSEVHPIASTENPGKYLLSYMQANAPEIMIMGTYGHSGSLKELFTGSVTKSLTTHSSVPLFLYH